MTIFKLPDLGEGLPDAEISKWHVKVGDTIQMDEPLVSMETAKAVVDVPSPISGKITQLHGQVGDVISTGSPLVEFETESGIAEIETAARGSTVAGKLEVGNEVLEEQTTTLLQRTRPTAAQKGVKATPAVRALAERLNVDLATVKPTGPQGTVTLKDVESASQASEIRISGDWTPLKGTRRAMAQAMSQSHAEVVPVTIVDDAHLLNWSLEEDITVRVIQAMVRACQGEPALNAWFEGQSVARQLFKKVDLGIAMDTPDGLFVPILRDAGSQSARELRTNLETVKKQVQTRTIPAENLRGATITLSNFGKFAGRYANPVIVPPQVAIVGVGKLREEAVVVKGSVVVSKVLPLALTFDHRACTGGEATRFLGIMLESLQAT